MIGLFLLEEGEYGGIHDMENAGDNKYVRLKRKIYLVIFPILFIINFTYWLFSLYVDNFLEQALPPLCLLILIVWVLIYFKRLMRTCEILSLALFGLYHICKVYFLTSELEIGMINVYAFWSPIYFIFIFLVLERKRALGFSIFILLISVVIGIFHSDNPRANDTLIQYYLSTMIYILILFYFKKVTLAYIESDMLKKKAYYDYLTGIANRRSVDTWLKNEVNRCHQTNHIISVIYFDIDYFKQVNDEYGHDIGDHVLKEFSSLVKSTIRPSDLFGRWGGEEFIIISTNQSLTGATQFAERLRKTIESHSFRYVDHVTSSFGVASYEPNDVPKTIINRADQALYRAKNNGRNKVEVALVASENK